jgi:hypothetical protein
MQKLPIRKAIVLQEDVLRRASQSVVHSREGMDVDLDVVALPLRLLIGSQQESIALAVQGARVSVAPSLAAVWAYLIGVVGFPVYQPLARANRDPSEFDSVVFLHPG